MRDLTINYNNANANEISNSLTQVEDKLKKSNWSFLCVQKEAMYQT
jgi:hypothetical protein